MLRSTCIDVSHFRVDFLLSRRSREELQKRVRLVSDLDGPQYSGSNDQAIYTHAQRIHTTCHVQRTSCPHKKKKHLPRTKIENAKHLTRETDVGTWLVKQGREVILAFIRAHVVFRRVVPPCLQKETRTVRHQSKRKMQAAVPPTLQH